MGCGGGSGGGVGGDGGGDSGGGCTPVVVLQRFIIHHYDFPPIHHNNHLPLITLSPLPQNPSITTTVTQKPSP